MSSVSVEALITDRAGRVLVLKPLHGVHWSLVGGAVGEAERPDCALGNHVFKSTSLALGVGRMLSVDWEPPARKRSKSAVHFVFDCGTVDADTLVRFPHDEFGTYRFTDPGQAIDLISESAGARLQSALRARSFGGSVYLPSLSRAGRLPRMTSAPCGPCRRRRSRAVRSLSWTRPGQLDSGAGGGIEPDRPHPSRTETSGQDETPQTDRSGSASTAAQRRGSAMGQA